MIDIKLTPEQAMTVIAALGAYASELETISDLHAEEVNTARTVEDIVVAASKWKRGDHFFHAKWLSEDKSGPMFCVVTKVEGTTIYWRPVYGGATMHFEADQADRYVKERVR